MDKRKICTNERTEPLKRYCTPLVQPTPLPALRKSSTQKGYGTIAM